MKIVHLEIVISAGEFPQSSNWAEIRACILEDVEAVVWPPRAKSFTIRPESGKKRGKGNGVKPIKAGFLRALRRRHCGWLLEEPLALAMSKQPGDIDALLKLPAGIIAVEWETGNVSSSHRAMNKMALGLLKGALVAGVLIVPSRNLYRFLTDRIGNWDELQPYVDLWRALPCTNGVLEIVVIEQDATSPTVRRIPKGTDGRAAG